MEPTSTEPAASTRRPTPARVGVLVVVALMVAMWGYVLYLAFGPGRQPPPDRLDDPTFAIAAQQVCRAALDDVADLPAAVQTTDPIERAKVISLANERFATMLDGLEVIAPPDEDGVVVRAWLADWSTYLRDRESYATALRTDPKARLLLTAKDNEQITEFVDAFAADNRMPACGTPLDVS